MKTDIERYGCDECGYRWTESANEFNNRNQDCPNCGSTLIYEHGSVGGENEKAE